MYRIAISIYKQIVLRSRKRDLWYDRENDTKRWKECYYVKHRNFVFHY